MLSFLNVHHLELFYFVAKYRGISSASRQMPYGIQQPAISGQIAQLEKAIGTKLFYRRPFELTPTGAKLFGRIESFFAGLGRLPEDVSGQASQHLRLAAPAIVLREYLPDILARHKRQYPQFKLTLHDANQSEAEELIRKREIDLAITELEGRPAPAIRSCNLVRLPLVLVVPKNSSIRSLKQLFHDGRSDERLISLPPGEVLTKQFQDGLAKLGLAWSASIEVSSIDLVDTYTSLGFGFGVSITAPRRKLHRQVRQVALPGFPRLTICAFWSGELSGLAASFLENVKKIATRLTSERNLPITAAEKTAE